MPSSYAIEISKSFTGLSKPDRDYLKSILIGLERYDIVDEDPTDWLLHGCMKLLHKRKIWIERDIRNTTIYKRFIRESREIRDYFEDKIPNMNRVEQLSLGEKLAEILADDLDRWCKVGLYSMISNIYRLPEMLEVQLPGYLGNGFLGLMIGRKISDNGG